MAGRDRGWGGVTGGALERSMGVWVLLRRCLEAMKGFRTKEVLTYFLKGQAVFVSDNGGSLVWGGAQGPLGSTPSLAKMGSDSEPVLEREVSLPSLVNSWSWG